MAAGSPEEPDLHVRPMEMGDLKRVLEIEREGFSTPWSPWAFRSLLRRNEALMRVLERPAEGAGFDPLAGLLGYAVVWGGTDEAELANIAIAREVRGRGLGGLFLDRIVAEVRERGVGSLFLEVRESNRTAQKLYRSRGFYEVGRRRKYYTNPREDALVLRKEL